MQSQHLVILHRCERHEISHQEAKEQGRKVLEDGYREVLDAVNKMAKAQGLPEAPIELIDEKWLREALEKWDGIVDDVP